MPLFAPDYRQFPGSRPSNTSWQLYCLYQVQIINADKEQPVYLGQGEHDIIGSIFARAFADDPVNRWMFNGAVIQGAYSTLARWVYIPRGIVYTSRDQTAGAMWLPPGVKKDLPVAGNLAMAHALVTNGGLGAVKNALIFEQAVMKARPPGEYYYLGFIAVLPGQQGRGLGGQMMQPGLTLCERDKMPALLESTKEANIPFYERFGFKVSRKIEPGHGCPPLWQMWRDS